MPRDGRASVHERDPSMTPGEVGGMDGTVKCISTQGRGKLPSLLRRRAGCTRLPPTTPVPQSSTPARKTGSPLPTAPPRRWARRPLNLRRTGGGITPPGFRGSTSTAARPRARVQRRRPSMGQGTRPSGEEAPLAPLRLLQPATENLGESRRPGRRRFRRRNRRARRAARSRGPRRSREPPRGREGRRWGWCPCTPGCWLSRAQCARALGR